MLRVRLPTSTYPGGIDQTFAITTKLQEISGNRSGVAPAFRVARYRLRATFGRRWSAYLAVVLLMALVGGVAMGAVAGARRTDSSFATFLASTNPSTIQVLSGLDDPALGQTTGYDPEISRMIDHLPLVEHADTQVGFDGNIDLGAVTGIHYHSQPGETPPTVIGGLSGAYTTQDRVTLVRGRLADPGRADEAVMNAEAATEMGLHVGSVIRIPFYTDAESTSSSYNGPPYLHARVKLVGVVAFASDLVQDDIDALGSATVLLSPALTRQLSSCCAYYSGSGLQLAGGTRNGARVETAAARISPLVASGVGGSSPTAASIETRAQPAIKPEAIALGVFGGIAGIAVLLIAAQLIGRIIRLGADETATLRALGADRRMALWDGLLGLLASVVIGSLLAVGVAVLLSLLTPLGPVRPVYPSAGFAFDWTVLGLGLVGLIVVVSLVAVVLTSRAVTRTAMQREWVPGTPGSGLVRSVATSGLPVSAVTGVRFALESGRGRSTVPVRSAILGAVLAVAVLVTTVTFGASLDSLVSHPSLYGWNWNDALLSGFAGAEDLPQHQVATLLDKDADIKEWAGVNFVAANLNGVHVQMLTESPGAAVQPPVLSGHGLEGGNQIVLGSATLAELHKKVGDSVELSGGRVVARRLRIVGTATMPSITKGLEMGTGAVVPTKQFPVSLLNPQDTTIPGPNAVLVRVAPGASTTAAYRSLEKITHEVNAIPDAGSPAGGVVAVLRPAEIVNYRSMGTTPAILGVGLAVGAVVALGLTLVASVRRRRRDLALLKTLGFTQRQLAAAISWQSSISVLIGTVVGVPLGIVVGRVLWNLFARDIDAVPAPSIPVLTITLIAVGAVVLANVVAAVPARMAARTPTALVLRAE
jgi:hypothetical protein